MVLTKCKLTYVNLNYEIEFRFDAVKKLAVMIYLSVLQKEVRFFFSDEILYYVFYSKFYLARYFSL